MKIRKIQVYLMLVLIAFGFLLTFSIKNNIRFRPALSDSEWEKKQQFQEKMLSEQERNQELERKLLKLNEQVAEMEKRWLNGRIRDMMSLEKWNNCGCGWG